MIPNISQQSLYPSLAAIGTSINTSLYPSIPFSRRVINDIEEHQRRSLDDSIEGTNKGTNTSPFSAPEEQEEEIITPNTGLQAGIIPAETQEDVSTDSQLNDEEPDPDIPDDQTSEASQEDNYCTAIDDDEQDYTIQFGNPITQPFLSRSVRVFSTG